MTDSLPADNEGDATIPIVPEAGYAPTEQLPFGEETLVDPASTSNPWSADSGLELAAPGYGASFAAPPQAPPQQQAPAPGPATYPQATYPQATYPQATYPPASYSQPPVPLSTYPTPAAYTQTGYAQSGPGYGQTGYGQPAPQTNYLQPQVAPSQPGPYSPAPVQGYVEPSGPADTIGAQSIYQGYPTAPVPPAPAPAWPAVIHDPVAYDYGYSNQANLSEHPNATLSLVLGLIGLFVFQLLSPVAWYLAAKGRREMASFPGRWRPSGSLTAGLVLGIIGTAFLALAALFILTMLIGFMGMAAGG